MTNELAASPTDPESYSELLSLLRTHNGANMPQSKVNFKVLSTLIPDIIAHIAVSEPGQTAAVTASIRQDASKLHTTIYVTFENNLEPDAREKMFFHLKRMLFILKEPQDKMGVLIWQVNKFSWRIVSFHLGKYQNSLQKARKAIADDDTGYFTPGERKHFDEVAHTLASLYEMARSEDREKWKVVLQKFHWSYSVWTFMGCISEAQFPYDEEGDEEELWLQSRRMSTPDKGSKAAPSVQGPPIRLFTKVENFMSQAPHLTYFPLTKWVQAINSLHTGPEVLFELASSRPFRPILEGTIEIEILDTFPSPYERLAIDMHNDTIRVFVQKIASAAQLVADATSEDDVEAFINHILSSPKLQRRREPTSQKIEYESPSVHCELGMLRHIHRRDLIISDYIGTSRPTCKPCNFYLNAYANVMNRTSLRLRGFFNGLSAGWVLPLPFTDSPQNDEIKVRLVNLLREALEIELRRFLGERARHRRNGRNDVDGPSSGT